MASRQRGDEQAVGVERKPVAVGAIEVLGFAFVAQAVELLAVERAALVLSSAGCVAPRLVTAGTIVATRRRALRA